MRNLRLRSAASRVYLSACENEVLLVRRPRQLHGSSRCATSSVSRHPSQRLMAGPEPVLDAADRKLKIPRRTLAPLALVPARGAAFLRLDRNRPAHLAPQQVAGARCVHTSVLTLDGRSHELESNINRTLRPGVIEQLRQLIRAVPFSRNQLWFTSGRHCEILGDFAAISQRAALLDNS